MTSWSVALTCRVIGSIFSPFLLYQVVLGGLRLRPISTSRVSTAAPHPSQPLNQPEGGVRVVSTRADRPLTMTGDSSLPLRTMRKASSWARTPPCRLAHEAKFDGDPSRMSSGTPEASDDAGKTKFGVPSRPGEMS